MVYALFPRPEMERMVVLSRRPSIPPGELLKAEGEAIRKGGSSISLGICGAPERRRADELAHEGRAKPKRLRQWDRRELGVETMIEANGRKPGGKEPSPQPDLSTVDDLLLDFEGIGAENIDNSDRDMPPRLTILQATSPQLKKQNENYLSDAQAGDVCNVVTGDLWRQQVTVIPCEYHPLH